MDYTIGNHELLEADYAYHVILQDRELPRRRPIAEQLHEGFPRGKFPSSTLSVKTP